MFDVPGQTKSDKTVRTQLIKPWEDPEVIGSIPKWKAVIHMFTYQPSIEGPTEETTEGSENTTVFTQVSKLYSSVTKSFNLYRIVESPSCRIRRPLGEPDL
mmetsp:Transcript_235/g.296  ORF Transcript_235/g.296 Transcript_235/m.296 type:complete len:101 (+) Transcript_235:159-461(+)